MVLYTCLLAICLLISKVGTISTNEAQFDRTELLNSTYYEGIYNVSMFRIAKFNRTTYVLNVEFENFIDIDENYELEVKFYFNRLNNNQYNLSPMRIPRSSYCATMQKFQSIIMSEETKNTTNLYNPDGTACPLQKVSKSLVFLN